MITLTLRWQHGDHAHERALAQGETAVLGRDPAQCSIALPQEDRTIHRTHAQIDWAEGGPRITSLGQNGVYVASLGGKARKGETARIAQADQLRLGKTEIAATVAREAPGERMLRCHNCNNVQEYNPREMCVHCGYALASGDTVWVRN